MPVVWLLDHNFAAWTIRSGLFAYIRAHAGLREETIALHTAIELV